MILLRGYDEDGSRSHYEPGKGTDITLPVWRVGEAVLYIGRLTKLFAGNLSFLVRCRCLGIKDRRLIHIEGRRIIHDEWRCADDDVTLEREVTSAQVRDNLVEVMHGLLKPLYERYSFFQLSEKLVAEELERMTRGRF